MKSAAIIIVLIAASLFATSKIYEFADLGSFANLGKMDPVLGPYDPKLAADQEESVIDTPETEKLTESTQMKNSPGSVKHHPGCWQMSNLDVFVPLDREMKRLLVKCFKQENWVLDTSGLPMLPAGVRIDHESEMTPAGIYTRYYLVGNTLDDARYMELKFKPNDAAGANAQPEPLVFRIQSGNPKTFSDECALADDVAIYETQIKAPIDYGIALCNADENRDLVINVTPPLPEGVEIQSRRVRPNRMLVFIAGKTDEPLHEIYKVRILRGQIQLNPISMELLISDPTEKPKVVAEVEKPYDALQSKKATIILSLAGMGDVYIDQKKVVLPHQFELDDEEHNIQILHGGKLEFSRRIPKLKDYRGPEMDLWNIVTTGSVAGYGFQSDREVMAQRIMELRRKVMLETSKNRNLASHSVLSLGLAAAGQQSNIPEGRLSLRELDIVVEVKVLKRTVKYIRDRLPAAMSDADGPGRIPSGGYRISPKSDF